MHGIEHTLAGLLTDLGARIDDARDGCQRDAGEFRHFIDIRHVGLPWHRAHWRRLAILFDVALVCRELGDSPVDRTADVAQEARQLIVSHEIGHGVMLLRLDSLAQHDLDPGILGEQFVGNAEHAPGLAEQFEPVPQCVGNLHGTATAPERRVLAARHVIVEHDEIPDVLELVVGLVVVFVDVRLTDAVARKHLHQADDAALDEMDAGGLEGFDEATGQSDGDTVASPGLAALPRAELDDPRLEERLALDIGQQFSLRLLIAEIAAAVHHAVADAMLQWNAPLPARLARNRARKRNRRTHGFGLHGRGAVAEQVVRPVLVAHVQRVPDEQPAKPGAIDEQVALEQLTGIELDGFDETRGLTHLHIDDLSFDAFDAKPFGELAQEFRVQAGIDVERIVHAAARQVREAALEGGAQLEAVVAVVARQSALAALEPEMLEACGPMILARDAEGMNVVLAQIFRRRVAPVLELDTQLERGLRRGHEFLLVDLEQAVEGDQGGNRRLADTHGTDLVGLDQLDVEHLAQRLR